MKKYIILAFISMSLFFASSCRKNETTPKTFVLVHGAWQAPYVWQSVKAKLEQQGQKVVVVELPAHGGDNTAPQNVSITVYRDKVIEAINQESGKVILVGHSMGGVVVTAVAESIPSKIEKLIYIGAFVPANGQSLQDLALTDAQSMLGPNLIPSSDQLTLDVVSANMINIFCQDCDAATQASVISNFRVEPAIPFTNAVTVTSANYGAVNKSYIHTQLDHAIGMDLQNRMITAAGISQVYSISTGHSPFLSKPDSVTTLFMQIAK